ncbi:hypothetical protein [Acinetobacter baumannii]|uniref:hypothetical protein n=1 Tax=Acinetobacter baumannii TaxID=470 RepID=UPI003D22FF52
MRATDVVGANTVVSIISKVLVLIFILFCAIYSDQAGKNFCIYFWDHSGKYEMVYSSKYYRFCVFLTLSHG